MTPVPLREITVGELVALLTKETLPLTLPLAWGAKWIVTVAFLPAAMVSGKLSPARENPAPLVIADDTVTLELPLFDKVAVFDPLLPTATLPNDSEVGDAFNTYIGLELTVTLAEATLVGSAVLVAVTV